MQGRRGRMMEMVGKVVVWWGKFQNMAAPFLPHP